MDGSGYSRAVEESAGGQIGPRAVEVWLARPDDIADAGLLASYERVLSDDERERIGRLRFACDRHTALVTRALVRDVLSRYGDRPPERWKFVRGTHGKPDVDPALGCPLRFNVSHTFGRVACAVTLDRDIGVDVEASDRPGETVELADRFFSPDEVHALRSLPPHEQRARFFVYWALKESYIKARGLGLALPLDQFAFRLDDSGPIAIRFGPRIVDDPSSWTFHHAWASEQHSLAVSVRAPLGSVEISVHETVPSV